MFLFLYMYMLLNLIRYIFLLLEIQIHLMIVLLQEIVVNKNKKVFLVDLSQLLHLYIIDYKNMF